MEPETSFIHTSDLHLNGEKSRFNVFSRIVSLCIKRKVAGLIIAGDLFDKDATQTTIKRAYVQFNRLNKASIPVYLIKGDEDAKVTLPKLPSNVRLLRNNGVFSVNDYKFGLFHGRPGDIATNPKADYMALGHFHDFTKVKSRAYYSGSPMPSLKYKMKTRYVIYVKFNGKKVRPIRIKL
jgi:DNA repair exonuclease SbcCD nuclease subunit